MAWVAVSEKVSGSVRMRASRCNGAEMTADAARGSAQARLTQGVGGL
jgi:hypothetical protein